jgi:hypothetical protein
MSQNTPLRYAAAGVAAVTLAFGAYSIGSSRSTTGSNGSATAAQSAVRSTQGGALPPDGQRPQGGQVRPGFGTPVTGTAAAKVKAAVLARHPGTVERIIKLPDGSYVAHVFTSGGELHVAVSKTFEVTGAQQGGPGAGRTPPQGGTQAGTPPSSGI